LELCTIEGFGSGGAEPLSFTIRLSNDPSISTTKNFWAVWSRRLSCT